MITGAEQEFEFTGVGSRVNKTGAADFIPD